MTTIRKTIIVAVVAGAVVVEIYQARQVSKRREQVQTLEHQQEPQAALSRQVQELQREHDRATNALAAENAALKKSPNEVLRTSRRSWKAAAGECQHRLQQCVQQNLRQSRNEKGDARQPEGAVD